MQNNKKEYYNVTGARRLREASPQNTSPSFLLLYATDSLKIYISYYVVCSSLGGRGIHLEEKYTLLFLTL